MDLPNNHGYQLLLRQEQTCPAWTLTSQRRGRGERTCEPVRVVSFVRFQHWVVQRRGCSGTFVSNTSGFEIELSHWQAVWILMSGLDSKCLSVLINKMETMPAWKGCYEISVKCQGECLAHSGHAMNANSFYFVFLRFCLGDWHVHF